MKSVSYAKYNYPIKSAGYTFSQSILIKGGQDFYKRLWLKIKNL